MKVYRVSKVNIGKSHSLYPWCSEVTAKANNLSNACRFRQRQLITARGKDPSEWTDNEKEVIREFTDSFCVQTLGEVPKKVTAERMEHVMRCQKNPDFFAKGLPRQSAQHVLTRTIGDMDNILKSISDWKEHPEKYKKKPGLPGYKRKGGHTAVYISNQDCTLDYGEDGACYAAFPFAKKLPVCIGSPKGRLKQAEVCPDNGQYVICLTFEVEIPDHPALEEPSRIAAIDFGINNLMAVANNCGIPCLLYKGGIVKSVNHLYNKKLAAIMAEEMAKPDCPKNKEGNPKFVPTEGSMSVTLKRNHSIEDFMHKAARHLVAWCVENRIDTIVAGVNKGWKQETPFDAVQNQNFVQIPFSYLRHCISYLAEGEGIRYVEREESYTSKASFLDGDYIPTYGVDDEKASFSGKRRPARYGGMYKAGGFRGLYRASDGTIINADLNGSANILRKEFPRAFMDGVMPNFTNVIIIRNPEDEFVLANKISQVKDREHQTVVSKSKAKRLKKKTA